MFLHAILLFSSFISFANDNSTKIEWRNDIGRLINENGTHYYIKKDPSKFLLITKIKNNQEYSRVHERMVYTKKNDTYTVHPIRRSGKKIQLSSKGEEIWNATAHYFFNILEKQFNDGK